MVSVALASRARLGHRKLETRDHNFSAHRGLLVLVAGFLATPTMFAASVLTASASAPQSPGLHQTLMSQTALADRGEAVGVAPRPGYTSGWVAYQSGAVIAYGGAPDLGSTPAHSAPVVGIAATPTGTGYWLVTKTGQVIGFGNASEYSGPRPETTVVGIAPSAKGHGYLLLDRAGNILSYGDAVFYGEASGRLGPFKAIATTPDGGGYWLLSTTGRVYNFGDAPNYGSTTVTVGRTFVAFSATPNGRGYWEATASGGIWSYGNAPDLATRGAKHVVSIVPSPTGQGYVEIDSRGNFYQFGYAPRWVPTPTPPSTTDPSPTTTTVGESDSTSRPSAGTKTVETTMPPVPATGPPVFTTGTGTTLASAATPSTGALTTTTPVTTQPPPPAIAGGVNLNASIEQNFASLTPSAQSTLMNSVVASGATWIRIGLPQSGNEWTLGDFTWYSDTEVKAALAAGLRVDGVIGWPDSYAYNTDGSLDMVDWDTFVETAAAHYSAMGVTTFEIWNEPNTSPPTGLTPADYAQMMQTVYPVIKAANPQDNVMVGGLAPDGNTADTYSPLTYLTDLYQDGAGGYFDSVGMHPYSFPNLPAQSANWNPWTYLPQLHSLMQANGDGAKKIWFTEFGAPIAGNANSVTLSEQACSYTQAFALSRGWTWAGPIFAYSWIDWDGDGTGWFGLYTAANSSSTVPGPARPALSAFEQAIVSTSLSTSC